MNRLADPVIYLDNNATTRVDPSVLEAMMPFLTEEYGNPSSAYALGRRAHEALDRSRVQVSALIGCNPNEIIFTSCGSESINTAITSALALDPDRTHVVTSAVEHSATMRLGEHLARRGHEVTWLPVDRDGILDPTQVEAAITPETAVVSLLWANNETGVLFPVEEIAAICRRKKVLFHCDAVQAAGKMPIHVADLGIDFLSLSGHKIHCPKGVGALYVSRRVRFHPLLRGSQEGARRAGTENLASIVALGKAAEIAKTNLNESPPRIQSLRDRFETSLLERLDGVEINGHRENRLPNTSNLAFEGIDGEGLLMMLDDRGIYCSAGSACTSGSVHASHVLKAMGFDASRARASLRFSFGRFSSADETDSAASSIVECVEKLRDLLGGGKSPVIQAEPDLTPLAR